MNPIGIWETAPLIHSWVFPLPILAFYGIFVLIGIPKIMESRKPFELKTPLVIWNFFLFIFSLFWGIFYFVVVVELLSDSGFYGVICDPNAIIWKNQFPFFVLWIFNISKLIELGDTVFLALRKKPIIFLHWYHHITVALYCWFSLMNQNSCGLLFGFMNSWVHTFMYWYYFRTALGARIWWGRHLTLVQIMQMAVGMILSANWGFFKYGLGRECSSLNPTASVWASAIMYGSYLILFINFYFAKTKTKDA